MKFLESIFKEYREDVGRIMLLVVVLMVTYFLIMYGKQLAMAY